MTASVTVPHWLSPQIVRKSQKRQVVNCCEEERQAGLFQVVSYDLWMQNVQLSVAWISKPLKYVTKKGRCDDACLLHQSISIWLSGTCIGTTVSGTGSSGDAWFGGLPGALYKCIGSMHRRVIGVWMMSVGYDEVAIVQKTVPGTHARNTHISYIFVFLHLLLLRTFECETVICLCDKRVAFCFF